MIKIDDKELIRKLRRFLEDNMYDRVYAQICGKINYCVNPWQTEDIVLKQLVLYSSKINVLFKLLLLGYQVDYGYVCNNIGKDNSNMLIDLGIARLVDEKIYSEYSLVSFHDRYFLVDLPYNYSSCPKKMTDVYIGFDSYDLTNFLPLHKGGVMLDLCSGSGIQGIFLASQADKVSCIEYNEKAVPYTKFNTILNGVDLNTTVYQGDLYDPIGDETFDVIVSNPPFIPVPEDIEYPICGDGSEDGLKIINRIVKGFSEHLRDNGCAMIIGECIGNKHTIFLYDMLKRELKTDFEVKLMLHGRSEIESRVEMFAKMYSELLDEPDRIKEGRKKWHEMFKKLDIDYYFSFTLKVTKRKGINSSFELISPNWEKIEYTIMN